jgi:hypothetical protein
VFLDVVKFSLKTPAQQAQIVDTLNENLKVILERLNIDSKDRVLLPTGDGMCICIKPSEKLSYDVHMRLAIEINSFVSHYNIGNGMVANNIFTVRIGVNQGTDLLLKDINNNDNLAGKTINTTARIMSVADGMQILVSKSVYEHLSDHGPYVSKFRELDAVVKHNEVIKVFQYIGDFSFINREIPKKIDGGFDSPRFATLNEKARSEIILFLNKEKYTDYGALVAHLKSKSFTHEEIEHTTRYMANNHHIAIMFKENNQVKVCFFEDLNEYIER